MRRMAMAFALGACAWLAADLAWGLTRAEIEHWVAEPTIIWNLDLMFGSAAVCGLVAAGAVLLAQLLTRSAVGHRPSDSVSE